jgi:hypothetical protein
MNTNNTIIWAKSYMHLSNSFVEIHYYVFNTVFLTYLSGWAIGGTLGWALGGTLGWALGGALRRTLGWALGRTLGWALGRTLGRTLGWALGRTLGWALGWVLGWALRGALGWALSRSFRWALGWTTTRLCVSKPSRIGRSAHNPCTITKTIDTGTFLDRPIATACIGTYANFFHTNILGLDTVILKSSIIR